MDPSARFTQAIPYLLLPISPALSAIHCSKSRRQLSSSCPQDPAICSVCGYYLHIGTSQSRVMSRRNYSKRKRVLQTTCIACESIQITPLDKTTPCHPSKRIPEPEDGERTQPTPQPKDNHSESLPAPQSAGENVPAVGPAATASRVGPSDKASKAKARPKKSGLQAMLSRSREQEEKRIKSSQRDEGGLSAFLGTL
ncbi:hypothetical protein FA15DRAFT_670645 [Coprinopsis marcescibilis]|uniref:Uncharacterized protein n=1 Tax=Coprinopsis marcescibilis TaxID=230819 RepID=A0A5C3KSR2_COPMA|nr:hypothetical protein FA15DRAFT_670645 [Coprinopsis marcescibilis]